MAAAKGDKPDTGEPAGEDVGAYYEDSERAEGLARLYDAATPLGEFYRDRMRRIAGLLEGEEGTLLDAGCGTGQMIRFLQESRPGRFALTGLDLSASNVEVARRTVADESVTLVVGRLEQMPLEDDSFDVTLAMGSLEYVSPVEQALEEIARVTRPGGLAIVTMQNPRSPYRLWEALVWSRVRRRRGEPESPIVSRLGKRQFRLALRAAGLEPTATVCYHFNLLPAPLDRKLPGLAVQLQQRLPRLARGPLRHLAADYIVAARRRGDRAVPAA